MTRLLLPTTVVMALCVTVSFTQAAQRGRGGAKAGGGRANEGQAERGREGQSRNEEAMRNKAPGGEWSERTHSGKSTNQPGDERTPSAGAGAAAGTAAERNKNQPSAAAGAAAEKRTSTSPTAAQGAAAGAAVANRNAPAATGAQGAAAGAAVANRNEPQFSGAQGAAAGAAVANNHSPGTYAGVRSAFDQPGMYGGAWYGAHPGAWAATGWGAGAAWMPTSWGTMAGLYGYGNNTPINYDYGGSVTCQNGNVVVNGQNVGTAAEFSQQAYDLAATGAQADTAATEKWLPLGVFAMVRNEKQHPQLIAQLAINEQGILRGNFTDEVTDHTAPIRGAVDKQTQRAAWTVGDNKTTVMEAGLSNLTEGEAPALIHKNGKTDHWILVRLDQPKQN